MDTPSYIKTLLASNGKKVATRKVWSIDLEFVWLPLFTATNVQGDTTIPQEAIGAPLRLAKAKDGSVKFSQNGRPVLKVVRELSEQIRLVRENFTAHLVDFAGNIQKAKPEAYKAEVEACCKAGEPIGMAIQTDVATAIALRQAQAQAEAMPERELVGVAA